jgi:integrase
MIGDSFPSLRQPRRARFSCCQLSPGRSRSQPSTASTPNRRLRWLSGLSSANAAASTRSATPERRASVAGHAATTGRGGKAATSCAPVDFTDSATGVGATCDVSTAITTRPHRTGSAGSRRERSGRYRPKVVDRAPRCIPDERFDELFAQLGSRRDRALVAFWVSTGARASELLGATVADVDPGQQLITVIRKGTRAMQPLPAAADAFVWLRLYQVQLAGMAPSGRDQPLW